MALVSDKPYPIRGGGYVYTFPEDRYVSETIADCGDWEPDVADAIERYANPDWTFLDLGAHVGAFSVMASRLYKNVIAVEPHPAHYFCLLQNIEYNNADIEPHNVAVSDHDGWVRMALMSKGNTGSSCIILREQGGTVPIPSLTLESILKGRRPQIIKADIEGSEFAAFNACPEILESVEVLITEYSTKQVERSSGTSGRAYYDLLTNAGLTVGSTRGGEMPFKALQVGGYMNIMAVRHA